MDGPGSQRFFVWTTLSNSSAGQASAVGGDTIQIVGGDTILIYLSTVTGCCVQGHKGTVYKSDG